MQRNRHARDITARFREMVEGAGDRLADSHYQELELLIEAGIDTALVDHLENLAVTLERLAGDVRKQAERFS